MDKRGAFLGVRDDGSVVLLGILGKLSQSRIPMKGTNGFPVNSSKIWMSGIQQDIMFLGDNGRGDTEGYGLIGT